MGAPGMGAPGMGAPGMGMGAPGMGQPGMMGEPGSQAQVPRYMDDPDLRNRIQKQLSQLPLRQKLVNRQFFKITEAEVQVLFDLLDFDKNGTLSPDELMSLATFETLEGKITAEDVETIMKDADKDQDNRLDFQEFHKALLEGTLASEQAVMNVKLQNQGRMQIEADRVQREELLEWMKYEYTTRESCLSLPGTLGFFIVFMITVFYHLRNEDSFSIHAAMVN